MAIYFPGTGTLSCAVCPGTWIVCSQGISHNFYPPHGNMGQLVPLSPPLLTTLCLCTSWDVFTTSPLLPIWMNVASLHPWLLDFMQLDFLMVLGVVCFEVSCHSFCGCTRQRSMLTYCSFLTGSLEDFFSILVFSMYIF